MIEKTIEVERIEHVISQDSFEKLKAALKSKQAAETEE